MHPLASQHHRFWYTRQSVKGFWDKNIYQHVEALKLWREYCAAISWGVDQHAG